MAERGKTYTIMRFTLLFSIAILTFGVANYAAQEKRPQVIFTDVTRDSGINFINVAPAEKKYIVESMGGGLALFDFDNDGKLDIYLLNSYSVSAALSKQPRPKAALYRNLGNGRFEDVATNAGVADPGWAMGVSVADFDNDGLDDIHVTCFGPNKLYRNRGGGKFEDVTAKAGVNDDRFSTGSAWGDFDRDGDLDLMVTNYVAFKLDDLPQFGKGALCQYKGVPVQCGPRGLPGAGDSLFRNNGDGTFTDISKKAGVDDPAGHYGLGVTWIDFDDDGWPDIFIANDATPNYAYRNNRDGTFTEKAFELGCAVDESGLEQGSMGISFGDYDRDGLLDLVVTNFSDQYNTIYKKTKDGGYIDASRNTKTADISLPYVGWGTKFFDYDNDGWLDLLVVNGHVYPQIEGAYPGGMYAQRTLFYRNLRDGTFEEIAAQCGTALMQRRVSRGTVFGDYDEDGDVDVIVNDLDGPPMLLRNDGGGKAGHWISLKLAGTKSNRNAVGARVSVKTGSLVQIDEVRAGDSYISHSDFRLHFGLGSAQTVDEIEVKWPAGGVQKVTKVPVDRVISIVEGKK